MTKTNQKKNARPVEDEESGIRTRKVRFTGDGFAFPEAGEPQNHKRKSTGRDAIIVEGAPGQGNIKNRSENSITELPEAKKGRGKKQTGKGKKEPTPSVQAGKGKQTEKKTEAKTSAPANTKNTASKKKKPAEKAVIEGPISEALAVLPTEKKPGPAKGKKKKSKLTEKNPDAVMEKLAEATLPIPLPEKPKPTTEEPKKPKAKRKKNTPNPKKANGEQKKAPATEPEKTPVTTSVPGTEKQLTAPETPEMSKQEKSTRKSGKGKKSGKKAVRDIVDLPTDHQKSTRKGSGDLILSCRFSYSGRGFGFAVPLEPEKGIGEDIFISPKATMGAMTGDTVTVRVFRHPKPAHSAEGEVEEITERAVRTMTGRLAVTDDYAALKPDNDKLRVLAYVSLEDCKAVGAKNGDKVEILPSHGDYFHRAQSITVNRSKRGRYDPVPFFDTQGKIAVIFGNSAGKEANYAAILHASGIRTEFPPYVKTAAAHAASQPLTDAGRVDLRERLIFTIDGADAKDLDDAISLDRLDNGDWRLGVHIADVSHYVPYESCVEKEARVRGTSVYFTDKVIPMLPEELSNGACSLNAGTDKYALSCEITLTPDGKRKHTVLYKSILRSAVRGVYSEINDLWQKGEESVFAEKYAQVTEVLSHMHQLYQLLRDQAADRGVMELEGSEARILLDAERYPIDIQRRERGDAEKMIEQFMLQANMGVAETLKAKNLPCLYRTHEEPDREKLRAFAVYAHNLGLPTFGLTAVTEHEEAGGESLADRLMGIIAEAHKREIGDIVSSVLLRSMMKAKYIAEPKPHFGLGADTYCHFTSPIRRYPDLFVHTVLTAVLPYTPEGRLSADTELPPEAFPQMLATAAPERGLTSTETEITAQQAEWKIEDLYMALYMSDKVGQVFDVTVVSVMKFGLFVQCENLVEGLVPAPLFRDAVVNENFCTLRSEGTLYTLGTKMQARLVEADPASGRITFAPLDGVE